MGSIHKNQRRPIIIVHRKDSLEYLGCFVFCLSGFSLTDTGNS